MQRRVPTRYSFGVILCRVNPATRRAEALLVHKRYTYAFAGFVHGRYARAGGAAGAAASALLEEMTTEELLDVWSLDFGQMWYRIWLSAERREAYHRSHARYQSAFMRDGGAALRRAVRAAAGRGGTLLWEVPKGRRASPREPDIICAVRELREEAGVEKKEYRLLPGARRHTCHISDGVRYVCTYYIAVTAAPPSGGSTPRAPPGPGRERVLRALPAMGEVSEARWHDIVDVRRLGDARLVALLTPALRLVKKRALL